MRISGSAILFISHDKPEVDQTTHLNDFNGPMWKAYVDTTVRGILCPLLRLTRVLMQGKSLVNQQAEGRMLPGLRSHLATSPDGRRVLPGLAYLVPKDSTQLDRFRTTHNLHTLGSSATARCEYYAGVIQKPSTSWQVGRS